MKKLMFIATAALCGAVLADEGIVSANIVGYTGKDVDQAKFDLIAAQFDKVGGGRMLDDLMTGVNGVDYFEGYDKVAPMAQIWNGSSYDIYYLCNDAWYDDGTEEGATKLGWADSDGFLADVELDEGAGFWLKNPTEASKPNVAGEVVTDGSADIACAQGFQLVANVFPMPIEVNGEGMSSADIVGVDYSKGYAEMAPQLQVWNGSSYDVYYYCNDAWYDDGTEEGDVKPGWADTDGFLIEGVTIPAMAGFWTKGVTGAFTLTFKGIGK